MRRNLEGLNIAPLYVGIRTKSKLSQSTIPFLLINSISEYYLNIYGSLIPRTLSSVAQILIGEL